MRLCLPQCPFENRSICLASTGICILLIACFHPNPTEGQTESEKNRNQWVVRDLYDQFPDEHVRSLTEYPEGAIWLGTWGEGLVRYDGRTRKKIRERDGLPSDFIRRVSVAPDGTIWVATREGAATLSSEGEILEVITEEDGLLSNDLFGMDVDSQGRIWLTGNNGASQIDPDGTIHPFATDLEEGRKYRGRSIAVDEIRGIVWIGWEFGTVRPFDLESREPSETFSPIIFCASQNVNDLELDSHNNLWVACDWDTFLFDGETVQTIRPETSVGDWGSGGLCAGPNGTMWLGLQIGLGYYKEGHLTFFDWRDGILQDNVNDIHVSDSGSVWAGTTGGLSFLIPSQFVPMNAPHPTHYRFISVLADSQGRVWAGGADLSYFESGVWHSLGLVDSSLDYGYPTTIIESRDGRILSSWNRRGVYAWKEGKGAWLPAPPILDQRFRALIEGPEGDLYLGNDSEGIYRFDGTRWNVLPQPSEGKIPPVLSLCFDHDGALWIGTEEGVYRNQEGVTEKIEFPNEGIETLFHEIIPGPNNVLYFATEGHGVITYTEGDWRTFNKHNSGLTTSKVYTIEFDDRERLWVGTRSNGLYRFQDGGWFHYQRTEGLPPARISDLSIDENGRVYLATYDQGFLRFTPEGSPPETILQSIPKDGLLGENLVIRLSGSDAWQSTMSDRLQYSWKMDDGPWSPPSPERVLSIPIERAGSHLFHVVAIDMDGNVDPTPEVATVIISPPFWRHPTTLILMALLGLSLTLVISLLIQRSKRLGRSLKETYDHQSELEEIVDQRTHALSQSEEEYRRIAEELEESNLFKERLIANVSHDFRTPLTSLQGYAQLLASKTPGELTKDQEEFLQIILNNATRMGLLIHNVAQAIQGGDIEKALDMKPVGLMELVWNCIRAHSIRAKDQKVELGMSTDGKEEDFYVMASRPLVERLLDNLISNGIKFTEPGGNVMVRLDNTNDSVILSVEDTGIGIEESELPHLFERFHKADRGQMDHAGGLGLGLSICKEIADAHGARIEVESSVSNGSKFRVLWPDKAD